MPAYTYNPGRSVDDEGNATAPPAPDPATPPSNTPAPAPGPGLGGGIDMSWLQPHIDAQKAKNPLMYQGFYGVSGGPGGYQRVPRGGDPYLTQGMKDSPYAAAYTQNANLARESVAAMQRAGDWIKKQRPWHQPPADAPEGDAAGEPEFGINPPAIDPTGGLLGDDWQARLQDELQSRWSAWDQMRGHMFGDAPPGSIPWGQGTDFDAGMRGAWLQRLLDAVGAG